MILNRGMWVRREHGATATAVLRTNTRRVSPSSCPGSCLRETRRRAVGICATESELVGG